MNTTADTSPVVVSTAPVVVEHPAPPGLAFLTATRARQATRVRWANRTADARAWKGLRRG